LTWAWSVVESLPALNTSFFVKVNLYEENRKQGLGLGHVERGMLFYNIFE
jgi:hypothetical protein